MSNVGVQTVLAALQTLVQAKLTADQVYALLSMPERTEEDVKRQLSLTDDAIQKAREDD